MRYLFAIKPTECIYSMSSHPNESTIRVGTHYATATLLHDTQCFWTENVKLQKISRQKGKIFAKAWN